MNKSLFFHDDWKIKKYLKKPGRTTTTTKYKRKHVNTKNTKPKKNTTRNIRRHTTVKKRIQVHSIKNRKTVGGRSYPPFTPTEIDYLHR